MTAVADDDIARIVLDTDRRGRGCLPGLIAAPDLAAMRASVGSAVERSQGSHVGFTGPDAVAGSRLDALAASPDFRDLIRSIYDRGTGRPAPAEDFHQVPRCLAGSGMDRHSLRFHCHSSGITALVPVEIPGTGRTGDLVMLPNIRRSRASYLADLVDKVLLDNAATQLALRVLLKLRLLPLVRIKPRPGDIYFFWRYRSIHTNEACDPDKVRATALFHDADPHAANRWKRSAGRAAA